MRSYLKVLIISMLGLILFIPSALADNAVKRVGEATGTVRLLRFPSRCIQQRVQLLSSAEVRMQMLYPLPRWHIRKMRRCFTQTKIICHQRRKPV